MKYILTLIYLTFLPDFYSQTYCDCDSIKGKSTYTNYCAEYLDLNLKPVTKAKSRFKNYIYYFQGKKVSASPLLTGGRNSQIYFENRKISDNDSIRLLNGVYKLKDKKGAAQTELFFDNGFCKKSISWYNSQHIYYLAEYDYSYIPFNIHVIGHKSNSDEIRFNTYSYYNNGNWYYEETTDSPISTNLTDLNKIPPAKNKK